MLNVDNLYDSLTKKAQAANKNITREIVEDWVGDFGRIDRQRTFMFSALVDLESGDYTADELVEDILQLSGMDN
jgi:hypothetical protein